MAPEFFSMGGMLVYAQACGGTNRTLLLDGKKDRVGGILGGVEDIVVAGPINVVLVDAGQGSGLEFDAAVGVKHVLAFTFVIGTVR